jgi:hypothetical protein
MNPPHPTDLAPFAEAYSKAWTSDPEGLLEFFDAAGTYTDVAMDTTYQGHEGI